MPEVSHWSTLEKFINLALVPQWIQGEDQKRVGAYDMYEAIYWTAPESFQLVMRGQEGEPIFVPSGRQVVDTAHRFIAPGMSVIADPEFGDDTQRQEANLFLTDFARRELLYSKFSAAKLQGIMRGDWLFHLFADPLKDEGSRVSIFPLNPSNYFPEYKDGDDITSIVAVHIAEPVTNDKGDTMVHKTVYRKDTEGGTPKIMVSEIICPPDEWGQPGTDMVETIDSVVAQEMILPDPITQIPVYHISNIYDPDFGWGSSEMRGIERLMRGINQAITDEELALVLEGLGLYTTDAGSPIDPDTKEP